jgi:hypothetical protein
MYYCAKVLLFKDTKMRKNNTKTKWNVNPFIEKTVEAVTEHTVVQRKFARSEMSNKAAIVNYKNGEVVGETALLTYKTVDNEQFAKVYTKGMARWSGMTPSVAKVFEYILNNLKPNADSVMIFEPVFNSEYNQKMEKPISTPSFYRSIEWLEENDFIAKSVYPSTYYINPTLFFNGSRLALVEIWETQEAANERIKRFKEGKQDQLKLDL